MSIHLRITCPKCRKLVELPESTTSKLCSCGQTITHTTQDPSRRFRIVYWPAGRRLGKKTITLPETIQSFYEARLIEQGFKESELKPDYCISDKATIGQLTNEFLDFIHVHRSRNTYASYKSIFKAGLSHFDNKRISDLTDGHILLYQKLRQTGVGNKTINNELTCFSVFLKWAEEKGIVPEKPIRIKRLKYERPDPEIISVDEVMRFINACEPFWRAFFMTTFCLGLRISEACTLRVQDISFDMKTVKVIKGKGGKDRPVPMPDMLAEILEEHLKEVTGEWAFPSPKNPEQHVTRWVRKAIVRAKKKAKITSRITPHVLRHSIATCMLGQSNLEAVRRFLGHKDIKTTTIYTHLVIDDLRTASDKVFAGMGIQTPLDNPTSGIQQKEKTLDSIESPLNS